MTAAVKEPRFHIVSREQLPLWKAVSIRLFAVLLSLIVCSVIIIALTGLNPIAVYGAMWDGAVGTSRRLWVTLRDSAILLCVALAITPAFRMRFWNIGAEGQVLIGGMATAAVMIYGKGLPNGALYVLMPVAGVLAGVLWGVIPALFKARWNTNETLFTLMMNYVAMQCVSFAVTLWENPKGSNTVGVINQMGKEGWLPKAFGNDYLLTIIIVLCLTVLLYIYMTYSKQGYELSVVGESENTARYAGINVRKVVVRTMAISGGICGVAGFLLVGGAGHTISTNLAGGRGFTAIVVAWLAKLNPLIMLVVVFLLVFMEKGSIQIASQFHLNESASEILTGIILFFVLGCEFFINYRVERRKKLEEGVKA
ncbi:MAG: ABC transporter permease [Clostridia bacterium]